MKKIITAIGNEILNKKLKEENDFEVIIEDIQYKEGIIEYLEKENNIDILIISELLPGNIELKELIKKIKNIKQHRGVMAAASVWLCGRCFAHFFSEKN